MKKTQPSEAYQIKIIRQVKMNQSENINEIAVALCKVQSEIKPALKDSVNPYHKSKYADLEEVFSSCRELLFRNGLSVMQFGDTVEGKPVLVSMLLHTSGQWIKGHFPIVSEKQTAQGIAASITYMRRYGLSSLIGQVTEDDDGETAVGRGKTAKPPVAAPIVKPPVIEEPILKGPNELITQDQVNSISREFTLCDKKYVEAFWVHAEKEWGITKLNELTQSRYATTLASIGKHIKMLSQV